MSDTPRTDAATTKGCGLMVRPAFAQGLERELNAVQVEKNNVIAALIEFAQESADRMEGASLALFEANEADMCWAVRVLKLLGVALNPITGERTAIEQRGVTSPTH